ncbi:transcriptional regulator [Nocardioides sp. AE5]|uniref:transcriptional regulator n=1 Tax=Nocardioides sp. AE5 TaxID=2962573 RepID=UPI0028813CBE|nr:transcriptional regulator [Nocardioides sp. AE5]MDT0201298.1 transcriptional regulator [Nocardioides sp. AE5]
MYPQEVRDQALALLGGHATLSEASRMLGVARSTLRSWQAEPVAPATTCFRCSDDARADPSAYAALLGFYLGDGCLSTHHGKAVLRVSCDAALPALVDDVAHLVARIVPGRTVFRVRAPGVIVVQAGWKHWLCLFPQHGPGRKHERTIALEEWQEAIVATHPGDFLRGLFHSDGSRTNNWARREVAGVLRRYDYPRWEFSNRSEDIHALCQHALDLAGVPWRRPSAKVTAVSTRAGVARLDALIGPKR